MSDIDIVTVRDFPGDFILFLSGEIDLSRLDEEIKMKKIVGVKIKNIEGG